MLARPRLRNPRSGLDSARVAALGQVAHFVHSRHAAQNRVSMWKAPEATHDLAVMLGVHQIDRGQDADGADARFAARQRS